MVNMGIRLKEGVREGRLSKDEASSSKRYGSSFGKKKDSEANAVIKLYPSLVLKNLIQPRNPSQILEPLPWWYKPELRCAFHQGALGHDIENCYPLKYEVQKLMKSGMVSFEDRAPNMKANPLPAHGNYAINMVEGCPGEFKVFDVHFIRRSLVEMHKEIFMVSNCEHDHDGCAVCSINSRGCEVAKRDIQRMMDEGMNQIVQSRHVDDDVNVIMPIFKQPERLVIQYDSNNSNNVNNRSVSPLVIRLTGPVPYSSDKAVPYQYNATMMKDGQEVPLPTTSSIVSITDVTKVTRSGRVFEPVFPKDKEESVVSKNVEVPDVDPISASKGKSGESSILKANDDDEVLRLIKRSEFNMVEQLLQTPSKISVLSLLMNSEAHREALQKVLEQAFVEYDVTVDQFDHIVANITSCNNLNVCDEELPEEGRNHNLALHISMNCKDDALSNVLVDTGSSLNVLPNSTLSKLSYQRAPMRFSGVIIKAFEVMDIHPTYSCFLGRPWIHEAGAVTSTLHQKLKFVKNGKLVIVGGEKALLVNHLSSFSYVEVEDEVGTLFQALSIAAEKRVGAPMSSLKDAKKIVEEGNVDYGGFIHGNEQHLAVVLEDDEEEDCTNFVTHGKACNN
ncbi:hypothetical protein KIW84_013677 [Lathyrus oleraceus]|uniref:Gag-pro-like protein n=1 Tax=Pisum sativum TaxID=3888 RepID=A0A9D5GYH2_PEA|nr:hypothetical protein KIW84_013677 [Pisum sativum]